MTSMPPVRRASAVALAVALAASGSVLAGAAPALAAAPGCTTSLLDVVAHPDDDLLFTNPDLIDAIDAHGCVTTAYLTAGGDAGSTYWQDREAGVKAAYAQMAGVTDPHWTTGATMQLGDKAVATSRLTERPEINLVFFRLPDGAYTSTGWVSDLRKLDQGTVTTLATVDTGTTTATTYTRAQLTASLTALMAAEQPDAVHTQDITADYDVTDDHPDNIATAKLVRAASSDWAPRHTLVGYLDWVLVDHAPNLTAAQITRKSNAFYAYAAHDSKSCGSDTSCAGTPESKYLQRSIVAATLDVHAPATTPTPTPTPTPSATSTPTPTQTVPAPVQSVPPASKPTEAGTPAAVIADATLTAKQFASRGVSATFTGLTPGRSYQPSIAAGGPAVPLGAAVVADARGTVKGTWKPTASTAPAVARPGRYELRLSGVETTMTLTKAFVVKNASAISWRSAHRHGAKVTLSVRATTATATHTSSWKGAPVLLQKRSGHTWRTVAVVRTGASGVATKTVQAGRATWRAVVAATATAWGSTSRSVAR